jgi:hypothetical protein
MASTFAAGMNQAALASAPRVAAAAAMECELPRTPPRGHAHAESTPEELAPAVAALAVQELSYNTFLSLAEMLI